MDLAPGRLQPAAQAALGRGLGMHPDDGLVVMLAVRDDAGQVVDFLHEWLNEAAERNAGRPLLGQRLLEAYGTDASLFEEMRELLGTGEWRQTEVTYETESRDSRLHRRSFGVFFADAGEDRLVCQYRDLTQLRRTQALLHHQAGHDDLTGVPNRRRVHEHLVEALEDLASGGPPLLVMLADLDRFKEVNDTHGHGAGDAVLRLAAERMRSAMRVDDVVARYGGDEFLVICHDVADLDEATILAQRLSSTVAGMYALDGSLQVDIGLSVGLCLVTEPMEMDELLRSADRALYEAKGARGDEADGARQVS
jgi:diguanylate cyclase (GGDEF)-like protein